MFTISRTHYISYCGCTTISPVLSFWTECHLWGTHNWRQQSNTGLYKGELMQLSLTLSHHTLGDAPTDSIKNTFCILQLYSLYKMTAITQLAEENDRSTVPPLELDHFSWYASRDLTHHSLHRADWPNESTSSNAGGGTQWSAQQK